MDSKLTAKNFKNGFLIDDEWMAGISEEPQGFSAFILNHHSGEYLSYTLFETIDAAIHALGRVPRNWAYESTSGCGGDRCGEGKCKGSACKVFSSEKAELLKTSRVGREV